jgi:ribose transport system permease protein
MSVLRRKLSFRNIGAVYVLLGVIVVFSIWVPATFPTLATVKQVFDGNAIIAILALSLLIPLSAGVFDLSIAYNATLAGVLCTKLVVASVPLPWAILIALCGALGVGLMNAIVVVVMRVDSFIGTLATGSLVLALVTWVTGNLVVEGPALLNGTFLKIGQGTIGGFIYPVFYVIIVGAVIWYVLEATATGRRLYATGFNYRAARLAGVQTERLRFGALLASAFFAGIAGVVLASTLGDGDPTSGTAFLLPAFAAAFLGATQLRAGRFNVPGTLVAVLLLGTGVAGLGLASAAQWAQDMFTGIVLIAALAVTGVQRRAGAPGWWTRVRRRPKVLSESEAGAGLADVQEEPLSTSSPLSGDGTV